MKDSVESMQEAIKILSLGLDYRRYTKFHLLSPLPMKTLSGLILKPSSSEKTVTVEDCQFCYNFVIESAVHI